MGKITKLLRENKEGIFIGGIVGFLAGNYFLPTFDLNVISQSFGVIDSIKPVSTTLIEFAKTKIMISSTIIGAIIGFIVDYNFKEGFIGRLLR